jgi:hypothetical protein
MKTHYHFFIRFFFKIFTSIVQKINFMGNINKKQYSGDNKDTIQW